MHPPPHQMRIVARRLQGFGLVFIAALFAISCPAQVPSQGTIAGFGNLSGYLFDFPSHLTNVTAISSGSSHVLVLRADATTASWGFDNYGQLTPVLTNIVAIAAGSYHSLALTAKGTVVQYGQGTPKRLRLKKIVAIAAGNNFSLALRKNGTITAWGSNAPAIKLPRRLKNVIAIAAGHSHALALINDGTVVAWGTNDFGQTNVPPGLSNVVMIAAGFQSSVALTRDGQIREWGQIASIAPVPDSLPVGIAQIAVGERHVVIRTTNGVVTGWGEPGAAGLLFPSGLTNVTTIAAGEFTTFAAVPYPVFRSQPTNQSILSGDTTHFTATAESTTPLHYQWFLNNSPVLDGTNASLQLTNTHISAAGTYFLAASNDSASATSSVVSLTVTPMSGSFQIDSQTFFYDQPPAAYLWPDVNSLLPASYQWYLNNAAIPGATNNQLVFINPHYADQGNYSVFVTNDDTNASIGPFFFPVPPVWSIADGSVIKTNGVTNFISFELSMDEPRGDTQQIEYQTSDETARANVDYLPVYATATFPPGTTNLSITVPVIGNTRSGPLSFLVNIFAISTTRDTARGWILDTNYVPTVQADDSYFYEGTTTNVQSPDIWLSAPSASPVSVHYSTADGLALQGVDYLPTNGDLIFQPGTVTQQLSLAIIGNILQQTNRDFFVDLSQPVNATLATNRIHEFIIDDDTLVLPPGFAATLLATNFSYASAAEFAQDGRLFVCEQTGTILVISNDTLLPEPFAQLPVNSVASEGTEDGLLGLAFDPGFLTNHYFYAYYTTASPYLHNRISRFTADGNGIVPGSENVVFDLNAVASTSIHNAGAIHFGPDGKLYIAVGENGFRQNAQSMTNLLGKILRINSDGSIPSDNPFYTSASGLNRAIWALGLRNPFSFAFQPGTGRMLINDVGENTWEEINQGSAGANYGWPFAEGPTNLTYQNPVFAYTHTNGCAIVGSAFYNPARPQFPATYSGNYFFADYCGGWINRMDTNNVVSNFIAKISAPVALQVGPDGALYCLTRGRLYKFTYVPTGRIQSAYPLPGGRLRLRFNGSPNVPYVLETSTNLVFWQPLATNSFPGLGGDFYDSPGGLPDRFYRLSN